MMNVLHMMIILVATGGTVTTFIGIEHLATHFVFAQSNVEISPKCGPKSGFNFEIIAGGFRPHTNVNWQLIDSEENVPLSGYFETDGDGRIHETTFADDLDRGHYKIYFGEDAENDGKVDASITSVYAELNIPCSDKK
jgi:hypothetical protein